VEKRSASRAVSHGLGPGDESSDRIVETEHSNFADDIRRGPGNREYAKRCWPKHPGDEKSEYAAEIGREHRYRVQERAAFQFDSRFVYTRRCVRCRRRNIEQSFR
jgi:hypothetical protein